MESTPNSPNIVDVDARVRSNTGAAALAGGLLILFGFFYLEKEVGMDASSRAANVFLYTIRFAGLALIGVAIWSSFGHLPALMGDAVLSFLIGAAFVVTALFMLIDFGWWIAVQALVYIICGMMFLNSGLRTWRDYREMKRMEAADEDLGDDEMAQLAAPDGSPLANQLSEGRGQRATRRRRIRRRADKSELIDIEPIKRAGRGALTTPQDQPINLDEPSSGATGGSPKRKSPPPHGHLADFDK